MIRAILTLALVALTAGCANTDWQAEKQLEREFQMYEAALDVAARDCGVGEQVYAMAIDEFDFEPGSLEDWPPQAVDAAVDCVKSVLADTHYANYD